MASPQNYPLARRYGLIRMKTLLVFTAFILLFGCQPNESKYTCFSNNAEARDELCYEAKPEKERVARFYFKELTRNIDNPYGLVIPQGQMAEFIDKKALANSVRKHFSHINKNSIQDVISSKNKSAIFLKTGETLHFDHDMNCNGLECQYCLMLIEDSNSLVVSNVKMILDLLKMDEEDYEEKQERIRSLLGQYFHYQCFVTQIMEIYNESGGNAESVWMIEKQEDLDDGEEQGALN